MYLLLFFLPGILLFGAITSYEDWKYGKIRNKWVLAGLIYTFAMLGIVISLLILSSQPINFGYISDYFINLIIAFLFSYALWYSKMWAAGDAKLFTMYAALLPLTVYSRGYIKYFPSFTLLVNTFVPLAIILAGIAILKTDWKTKKDAFKKIFNKKMILKLILSFFGIYSAIKLAIINLGLNIDPLELIIIMMIIYASLSYLSRKVKIKSGYYYSILIVILIVVLFNKTQIFSLQTLPYMILYLIVLVIFRYFIIELGSIHFSNYFYISELKPGMLLDEDVYYKNRKIVSKKILTKKDIYIIKKKIKKGKIKIKQSFPFAPIMFLGVLITILINGSFLNLSLIF